MSFALLVVTAVLATASKAKEKKREREREREREEKSARGDRSKAYKHGALQSVSEKPRTHFSCYAS